MLTLRWMLPRVTDGGDVSGLARARPPGEEAPGPEHDRQACEGPEKVPPQERADQRHKKPSYVQFRRFRTGSPAENGASARAHYKDASRPPEITAGGLSGGPRGRTGLSSPRDERGHRPQWLRERRQPVHGSSPPLGLLPVARFDSRDGPADRQRLRRALARARRVRVRRARAPRRTSRSRRGEATSRRGSPRRSRRRSRTLHAPSFRRGRRQGVTRRPVPPAHVSDVSRHKSGSTPSSGFRSSAIPSAPVRDRRAIGGVFSRTTASGRWARTASRARPAGARSYVPVHYMEPPSALALGFDIASEPDSAGRPPGRRATRA